MTRTEKGLAWMRFFRLPGAGSALTGSVAGMAFNGVDLTAQGAIWVGLSSVSLYSAGMGFNDLADIEKDRQLRPERPLPSGHLFKLEARLLCWLLLVAGVVSAAMAGGGREWLALALAAAIALYNGYAKMTRAAGLSIGACRVLNYCMGAGLVWSGWLVALPALAMFLHVQAIMIMAEGEDRDGQELPRGFYACISLTSMCLAWLKLWLAIPWLLVLAWILQSMKDNSRLSKIKAVGQLVLAFSLLDAVFMLYKEQTTLSVVCVFVYILSLGMGAKLRVG